MPVALKLVARNGIRLPHRMMAQGDALIPRLEFDSDEDAKFFASQLRWSAFQFLPAPAIEGHVVEADGSRTPMESGEVITADLFDLLAGAKPEELAELKGIGPKKAAELIESAQAFVADRAARAAEEAEKAKAGAAPQPPADS